MPQRAQFPNSCTKRLAGTRVEPVTLAMRVCLRSVLLSLLALAAVTCSIAGPDDWPGWRGPSSNGVSSLKNLPYSWSHDQNVAWKTAVPGRGHASPVVWGNRVFLTTDIEGDVIPGAAPVKHKAEGRRSVTPIASAEPTSIRSSSCASTRGPAASFGSAPPTKALSSKTSISSTLMPRPPR